MKNYNDKTDEELIACLRDGDGAVEEYLINKYKSVVKSKARFLFLEGGDQEDLLQEGMLGLFKAIRDFSPEREASFATYANKCISNQMYTAIEAANRKKHAVLNRSVSLTSIANGEEGGDERNLKEDGALITKGPELIFLEKEAKELLEEKIRSVLSAMEYEVLKLYLKGEGYKEIGMQLGKSEKSIDNALQRVRAKIRASLEKEEII